MSLHTFLQCSIHQVDLVAIGNPFKSSEEKFKGTAVKGPDEGTLKLAVLRKQEISLKKFGSASSTAFISDYLVHGTRINCHVFNLYLCILFNNFYLTF